jgi:hypothetical protein
MGVDDGHYDSARELSTDPEASDADDFSGPLDEPFSRRRMLAGLGGAAAGGIALGSVSPAEAAEADAARKAGEVGVARPLRSATRLVGRVDQRGKSFVAYGFLTVVAGLREAELFSSRGNPLSEATAYFTFHATASLVQRSVIDDRVFVVDVVGRMRHYYQASPGSSFDHPSSFARGKKIATSSIKLQDILSTIAPNEGIPTIEGPVRQLSSARFRHGGRTRRFGHRGLRTRLFATGRATRTDPNAPVARLSIAGSTVVTR